MYDYAGKKRKNRLGCLIGCPMHRDFIIKICSSFHENIKAADYMNCDK